MCSVNLIVTGGKTVTRSSIQAMTDVTRHRGPDHTEYYLHKNVALGFNRLQIVGRKNGGQPIISSDESVVLVCNGEIFNYIFLKEKYFPGRKFATDSDAEIVIHLYKKFGIDCLQYLEGQFSLILFDKVKKIIFAARDTFGILPLYYTVAGNGLIISSEIKAILRTGKIAHPSFHKQAFVETWMSYGPTPPNTLFTDIQQLPISNYLEYSIDKKKLRTFGYKTSLKTRVNKKSNLTELMDSSVKSRLQGDYQPGVYISGGIDSAIIASLVKKMSVKKPLLFGITFEDKNYDESYFQKILASYLHCKYYSVHIKITEIISNLEKCVFHTESPLIRSSPVPMMLLSKIVREKKVKFVLCGEGSDELFLGYPVFSKGMSSFEDKYQKNLPYVSYFLDKKMTMHAKKTFRTDAVMFKNLARFKSVRLKEIETKLSRYLLSTQGDRVAMANSVEQRFPYLDSNVSEFALGLKKEELLNKKGGKRILYKYFANIVPKEIVNRQKKGYLAPDIDVAFALLQKEKKYFNDKDVTNSSIFDLKKIKFLINKVKINKTMTEEEARLLLFVATTSILYNGFLKKSSMLR